MILPVAKTGTANRFSSSRTVSGAVPDSGEHEIPYLLPGREAVDRDCVIVLSRF